MGQALVSVPDTVLLSGEALAPSQSSLSVPGRAPLTVTQGRVTEPSMAAAPASTRIRESIFIAGIFPPGAGAYARRPSITRSQMWLPTSSRVSGPPGEYHRQTALRAENSE